jgi:hypothetical protein
MLKIPAISPSVQLLYGTVAILELPRGHGYMAFTTPANNLYTHCMYGKKGVQDFIVHGAVSLFCQPVSEARLSTAIEIRNCFQILQSQRQTCSRILGSVKTTYHVAFYILYICVHQQTNVLEAPPVSE